MYNHSLQILVNVGNTKSNKQHSLQQTSRLKKCHRELKVRGVIIKFIKKSLLKFIIKIIKNNFHSTINRIWENDSRDFS